MNQFLKFMADHHEAIATGGYFIVIAFAVSMPPNWDAGIPKTLWKWIYDGTQEAISMRSGKLVSGPAPKPAVSVPPATDTPAPKETPLETHQPTT